jgi:outer membrane protein OmpA-like peptidoglycan-associated protein
MQHVWKPKDLVRILPALIAMSCQTVPIEELPPNADPSVEISKVEAGLDEAEQRQADVLAPTYFKSAKEYLKTAQVERDKNKENKKILHEVAKAKAYLTRAESTVKLAEDIMPGVIEARHAALEADAVAYDRKGLESADSKLKKISKDLEENDKAPAIKRRSVLQQDYATVELNALQRGTTGPAEHLRDKALREGAKVHAPRTLTQLEQKIRESTNFVALNVSNKLALKKVRETLEADANRLIRITRDSKALNASDGEAIVLERESSEAKLAAKSAQVKAKDKALAETTEELAATEQREAELAEAKSLQDKIKAAQREFSSREVQMIQQGRTVTMRLIDLRFLPGQSSINSNRFVLLNRVRTVIDTFAPAEVVIQGHTDATGASATNQALSLARAEAIRDFLESARAKDPSKQLSMRAEGLGDQYPVASNKTVSGRALNRRVDIVIVPQVPPPLAH